MDLRSRVPAVLFVLVLSVASGPVASGTVGPTATDGYEISISESITVPNRTVTIDGRAYTISSVAERDPGDDLSVSVDAPSGSLYSLQLWNADNRIVAAAFMHGNGSTTFEADVLDPGLYYVAASDGGSIEAIHPVVVEAYEVTADFPETAQPNGTIRVAANLTEQAARNISTVEVVVADQDVARTVTMNRSEGEYAANVTLDEFSPGSYFAYVVVRGEKVAHGANVPIGLSGEHALDVTPCIRDAVAGSDDRIGLTEIQTAIHWWATDQPVPGTDGWTVDLATLQDLVNAWAENAEVDCT